jgi:uncharacterized protein
MQRGKARIRAVKLHPSVHPSSSSSRLRFTGYGDGFVLINTARRETSVIVLPERMIDWPPQRFDALAIEHFAALAALEVEVVLLGTGARQRFPASALTEPLRAARIGLEVMDVPAACRTYNILLAEERRVAAALLLEATT